MGGDNVPYDWSIPIRRKDGRLVRATSAIPVKKVDAESWYFQCHSISINAFL